MVELDVCRGDFSDSLSFASESIELRPPGQTTCDMKDMKDMKDRKDRKDRQEFGM